MLRPMNVLIVGVVLLCAAPADAMMNVSCEMKFDMKGWSVFYRTASGEGTITCNNGQRAKVTLEARGGGLTFGRRQITDAIGKFSEVSNIRDLYGVYAQAEAHAGAGKSTTAQVVTKGEISLAIAGTGTGVDVGVAFGRFEIIEVETVDGPPPPPPPAEPAEDATEPQPPAEEEA